MIVKYYPDWYTEEEHKHEHKDEEKHLILKKLIHHPSWRQHMLDSIVYVVYTLFFVSLLHSFLFFCKLSEIHTTSNQEATAFYANFLEENFDPIELECHDETI